MRSLAASTLAALLALGCGGADATGAGGEGGSGGETSSQSAGGGGQGGEAPDCPVDCSTIMAPICQVAVCDAASGQCIVVAAQKGTPCDDQLFCTVDDHCEGGACVGGAPYDCGVVGDACSAVTCNEATHGCSTTPLADGASCTIDDPCTVNAACKNGLCIGAPKDCFFAPVPDACHVATCNPVTGTCDAMIGNEGGPCPNDGDLCMVSKTCAAGVCQGGVPKNCSAIDNGCNLGVCDPTDGACVLDPIPPGGTCAEATDECNTGICDMNGVCNPVPNPGDACPSKANECNDGVCDALGACQPAPKAAGTPCASKTDTCNDGFCDAGGLCLATPANEGGACEDGNSCTSGETCTAGSCTGGVMGTLETYFTETFSSNTAGWTLDTEWGIGPAMVSVGQSYGNPDPGMDHTATADNGVAGVVIGGNAQQVLHAPYYLTSPPIDVSAVAGPLYLEFWRWLNSDYLPFMKNTIDVWNGTAWVNVWASGSSPGVQDAAWTHVSHDLTAYKNAALQVRFGFEIGSSGVYSVGSWNIDDVTLANQVCN